jgi:hypothetical protein
VIGRTGGRAPWVGVALAALVFLFFLPVIATPGYFSHDEWQRADAVTASGFDAYAREYGSLKAGPEFGFPVRPIGFVQQGVSGLWMRRSPPLVHAIDVAIHAAAVLLLWRVLLAAGMSRRRAVFGAAVFAISPLATLAVAWVGASFDRWYVLFSLVCALGVLRVAKEGLHAVAVACVVLGAAGAILSKETALMLPAALLLMLAATRYFGRQELRWRPALASVLLAAAPVMAYLFVRWPAIEATLHAGGAPGPYSPSLANVPQGMVSYLLQPFMATAVELVSAPLLPMWQWVLAALLHLAFLGLLWLRRGAIAVVLYFAGYLVFLLPVLPLPTPGAHYLYGSGLALAVALAALLPAGPPADGAGAATPARGAGVARVAAVGAMALVALLALRAFVVQNEVYSVGRCQAELLSSFEPQALAAIARGASRSRIVAVPGAREWVAVRSVFGRRDFMAGGAMATVVGTAEPPVDGEARFLMGTDCRVIPQ